VLLLLLWRARRSMRGSFRALHADTVTSVLWRGRQQRGAIPHWLLARPLTRPLAGHRCCSIISAWTTKYCAPAGRL
jgi:hypothetical protein